MNSYRDQKMRQAGTAGAAALLTGLLFLAGAETFADESVYELQKKILRSAEEMYMPGLAYLERDPDPGVGEWLREKALAWMPLVNHVCRSIYNDES